MKPTRRQPKVPTPLPTRENFQDLRIDSDGSRPTIRHKELPNRSTPGYNKMVKRATERQRLNDMERQNIRMVETAIKNKKILNFYMSEFVAARRKGSVPMAAGGPFKELANEMVELKEASGPTVLVDLEDTILFWYFPRYIGKGFQMIFLDRLDKLVKVYPPRIDGTTPDRRSKGSGDKKPAARAGGPTTRSRSSTMRGHQGMDENHPASASATNDNGQSPEDYKHSERSEEELEEDGEHPEVLDLYVGGEGEVAWASNGDGALRGGETVEQQSEPDELHTRKAIDSSVLDPSSYYLSPAWYQSAMEHKRPLATSLQFREALQDKSSRQLIALLEAKRLYDGQLKHLTNIIHSSLGQSMQKLRGALLKVRGPTQTVLENGWTSPFPCFGVGINRTSAKHRDTNGLSCGMDVIGVLGDFTDGRFRLQDLNVEAEWRPGCLGAFDGYDLTHEVLKWEGSHRITMLNFCQGALWRGLRMDPELTRPTLDQVLADLSLAKAERNRAVEAAKRKHSAALKNDREMVSASKRLRVGGLVDFQNMDCI